jgi:broad specificity phosphatase PhoE
LEGRRSGLLEKIALGTGMPARKYRPELGENWKDVERRAASFFNSIYELHAVTNQETTPTVVVVSHKGFLTELVNVFRS